MFEFFIAVMIFLSPIFIATAWFLFEEFVIRKIKFKKSMKLWYAHPVAYPNREDQIAWIRAVEEIKNEEESLPESLPGGNMFVCLNGNCDEPTYENFCVLCEAEHDAWGISLKINEKKVLDEKTCN